MDKFYNLRSVYDGIFNNFTNGNHTEMVEQLQDLAERRHIDDFINYFVEDLNRLDELPRLMKLYFNIQYKR